MRARSVYALTVFGLVLGCEPGFPSPSEISALRVLAVRPEPASGAPGATVTLEMLLADGKVAPGDPARPIEVAWLLGCHNPPSRFYFACLPGFRALAAETSSLADLPPGIVALGPETALAIPDDIISGAPRIATDPVHFGVSYAFFAVCAGSLRLRPDAEDGLPIGCVDRATGAEIGASDFVAGFATIFSYEGVRNENPVLEGVELDGEPVPDPACDGDPSCLPIVPRCTDAERERCPVHRLAPMLSPASAERTPSGNEILWAKYYASGGEITKGVQLVSDRTTGLVADYTSGFRAPAAAGPVRIWVTMNDQRGGAAWSTFDVMVE
jgi:hypothetical protein